MIMFWSILETVCISTAAIFIIISWVFGTPSPDVTTLWLIAVYALVKQQYIKDDE